MGNVREEQNFLQVREKSGNFEKIVRKFYPFDPCQGIVRGFCDDLSGNFVMTLFLD